MKKRIFVAELSFKASSLLLGVFLVLAIAFHPNMATAQLGASCNTMQDECFSKCNSTFDKNDYTNWGHNKNFGCVLGCAWYRELCIKNIGKIITASAYEDIILAEATLQLLEKVGDHEWR